jgi:HSP20 family molecular chaperone IbpA
MSSFMQKLRGSGALGHEDEAASSATEKDDKTPKPAVVAQVAANPVPAPKGEFPVGATQLPVDVYQVDHEIIIFTQVPGSDLASLTISIEGDHDTVVIQGACKRPEEEAIKVKAGDEEQHKKNFILQECTWGSFYRQIILPHEIDPEKVKATFINGALVLRMPLISAESGRIQIKIEHKIEQAPVT